MLTVLLKLVNLLFSNYVEELFSTQTKYIIFYVWACSEQRPTRIYNVLMRRSVQGNVTGLKIFSLLFQHNSLCFLMPIIPKIMLA